MKFVAEYLENTSQILLRLLSNPEVVGDVVQVGTYIVDGTPRIPEALSLDISSDTVKNGEAHLYLTGYWPLPEFIEVTLPDASKQSIKVVQVVQHSSVWEPLLAEQPLDTITPIEPETKRPAESGSSSIQKVLPPDYPSLWVEISLERSDPLRLGNDMVSDPLNYIGGGEGRALSATQKQIATNYAPYLNYAPTRLEGGFTNSLFNAEFSYSPTWTSPYFDPQPDGWTIQLADPMALMRLQTDASSVLPALTLRYHQRTGSDTSSVPPVTVLTPAINNAGETFQAIILSGAKNAEGSIQLKTEDESLSSQVYLLNGNPIVVTLPIGTHTGRVKIVWNQTHGDGEEQVLQIVAPCSSFYIGGHSWIPTGKSSEADTITLNNVSFGKPWYFNKGSIRVDGQNDDLTQPYSWEIKLGTSSFLKVEGGILSSDFMVGQSVLLSSHLPQMDRYRLVWASPANFALVGFGLGTKDIIPFALDISTISDSMLPITVVLKGFKANEGSVIAKRWAWLPS